MGLRVVGLAIRELRIPIGAKRVSALGIGTGEITEDLNPAAPQEGFDISAARAKCLNETPMAGTNTLLVSRLLGSRKKEEWIRLRLGEIIVF